MLLLQIETLLVAAAAQKCGVGTQRICYCWCWLQLGAAAAAASAAAASRPCGACIERAKRQGIQL
jgi:hypothetical protein